MSGSGLAEKPQGTYWDWNATTPPSDRVLGAMREAEEAFWANPSSPHAAGRAARARIESVRERLAALCETHPRDVAFVASGTEANNLALRGASGLVTSRLEHPSVVRVAEHLESRGVPVAWLPVPSSGRVQASCVSRALEAWPAQLRSSAVVAVAVANHETGVVQDVAGVVAAAHRYGARVHADAAQAVGKLPHEALQVADSTAVVAHKIRGPRGIAALLWRGAPPPRPVLLGGSQERGLRPGTLSTPLICGFGAALEELDPERHRDLASLRDQIEQQLAPFASVNGAEAPRLAHVTNLSFRDWTGERLVAALDQSGIWVSSGSACSVGTAQPSQAIAEMLGQERARCAVRISLGVLSNADQLRRALPIVLRVVRRRSCGPSSASRGFVSKPGRH